MPAEPSPVGGSGSSASAAPGSLRYAHARAGVGRGGRRAGTGSRRRTSSRSSGVEVEVSPGPESRHRGWEAVVSTRVRRRVAGPAAGRLPRRARRRCGDAIVVAGAHGKGTTAAMIAFVLDETRARPGVPDRRPTCRSSGATPARAAGWLVVEGDESDGTVVRRCAARSPSSRTSSSTTTRRSPRSRRSRSCSSAGSRHADAVVRGELSSRSTASSPCPASTTGATRRAALAALELAGVAAGRGAAARSREFAGTGRRFELRGEAGGVTRVRRLRPPPDRARPRRSPRRGSRPPAACSSSSSRTSTRARGTSRASSAPRSPRADAVVRHRRLPRARGRRSRA